MKQLISEHDVKGALERGRKALERPHAVRASYNKSTHTLSVEFSTGLKCSFDVRKSSALQGHVEGGLSDPYVTPGDDGLIFNRGNFAIGLPALIAPFLPREVARRSVATEMGSRTSAKKAAAARENGARGGRPRKELSAAKS